ncbi:GNAT family N-acetyltransferase [Cellulomonas wangsupingiae]|uniref:GNAT family N-acetyltransferase n=1 Tax=Cellulomonas wangsupingiae TaxID=2968085 RepID=A0ABY5K3Y1_9CELL|nr:GNAT family N-acetyltransferase [Cellulomonas wangsupingiae]MCC2335625.1 GNAT family N-acetyltransferase [Cellulomonas wangsupingiae]MCM0640256.1 GNAT family N-acetyltransferase [Cellulomonas wangsupingiae]UUI63862.1 GNAT family N-acetyltransferase [Cellulomonas wangsupingiae]
MVEHIDEVTIRPATTDDAAAIAAVHIRSWQEAYAGIVPDDYLRSLDPAQRAERWAQRLAQGPADHVRTLVAESGGRMLGFASFGPSRDEDARRREREIYSIYLDPGTWGHGVARDLMRTVLAETGEHTPMSLWVLADNARARHFYRRHGFAPDGVERLESVGGADLLEVRYRRG